MMFAIFFKMANIRGQQIAKMLKFSISSDAPIGDFPFLSFIYFENERYQQN